MSSRNVLCYSGAPGKNIVHRLGTPHYSYRFAEEKFLRCFQTMGIGTHFIAMPEFFSAPMAYEDLPLFRERHVHVIFRSTEEIRILKDGYNILCYAWEFPFIKDHSEAGEHPFLNQKRMLSLCDEVWVPCRYTRDVLESHGLENVHVIPAPIFVPAQPRLSRPEILARLGHLNMKPFGVNFLGSGSTGRSDQALPLYAAFDRPTAALDRRVYLSVFNPEDFRKNLDALVRGFDAFQQRGNRDDVLIIKALTSSDRFDLDQVVHNVMIAKLDSGSALENNNILVFNELLSAEEMTLLYDLADFYICTSIAEGQNLPLQEAMTRGIVPVTTCNTAMLDYIDAENAILIATRRVRNTCEHLAGNVAGKPYDVELCSSKQVLAALEVAANLNRTSYERMSAAARARIVDGYSGEALRGRMEERFAAIAAGPAEQHPSAGEVIQRRWA